MQHHPRRAVPSYKTNLVNQQNPSKFAVKQRLPISYEPGYTADNNNNNNTPSGAQRRGTDDDGNAAYEEGGTTAAAAAGADGGPVFVDHNRRSQPQPHQQQPSVITFGALRNEASAYPNTSAAPAAARPSGPWVFDDDSAGLYNRNNSNNNNVFIVDGARTGQEVLVSKTQQRQPLGRRRSNNTHTNDNNSHNNSNSNDHGKDSTAALLAEIEALKKKLAQASAERKAQTEKLKSWKKEMAEQQQALWSCVEEEWLQRRGAELDVLQRREAALQRLVAACAAALAAKGHEMQQLELQYRNEKEKNVQLGDRHEQALARAKGDWEAAEQRRAQEREAQTRAQSDKEAAQSQSFSEKEIARLKKEMAEMRARYEQRVQQLEAEKSGTEEELMRQIALVKTLTEKQAQDAFLVAQCRRFVHAICQPGFSVVKGTNLEPVEKDRPEPTGYVLVPLVVLLQGYTLLPEEERRGVVEQYDEVQSNMK